MSKVVMYQYGSLSTATAAVLHHYKKLQFLEVVPYDIPLIGKYPLLYNIANIQWILSCHK